MKILVPVDGSPASIRAVKLAVNHVRANPEASLVLMNVQNFSGLNLPEGTIDRVARDEHVQHIFMGTRGLGGVRGLLLGSVATQLLHLIDVPVTLVK
jgi:nucleotide-binding universal stress UspA family protein